MCDKQGYLVFLYDSNGDISNLAGTIKEMYADGEDWYGTDEVIDLPRAFMMGKSFNGRVFRTKRPGRPVVGVIPAGVKPVTL